MAQIRDILLRQQSKFETKQDRQMFRRAVLTTEGGLQTSSDPLNDVWANRNERRVWHMADGATQPAQVLCRKVSNPYVGLGVIIGYADGSNAKEVLTTDFFLTGAGTNLDGWDDTGPEDLEPGGNKLHWIYTKVITPLATYPDPTGLTVNVISGDYPYLGSRKTYAGSASYALTQNPNAGQHYLAGLYLDAANTLQVVYGTSVSTATTAPEPSWPAGAFRLSAVLIDDVQTSIDFDTDIFDRRLAWSDEQAGGSGWPFAHILTVSATDADADYSTIAAAIAGASTNDLILVDVGTFNETITLNKKVTLRGAGRDRTFIDSTSAVTLTISTAGAIVEEIGIYNHSSLATTVAPIKCGVNGVVVRSAYVSKYGANSTIVAGVWNSGANDLILDDVTVVGEPTGTSSYGLYSDVSSGTSIIQGNMRGGTDDIFGSDAGASVYLFLPILYTPSYSWAGTVNGWFTDTSGGLHKIGSGGTSQYVKQTTADGALTVGTIAAADLPTNASTTNYVILPTVGSNDLTVTLKTLSGGNPSASDPVVVRIGDTVVTITSTLSTTKAAGTNWFNSGAAAAAGGLATNAIDYFVYLINETGASAGVKIGFARIPWATTMGNFTNTTTSEKYIAGNWTNFNATDEVTVIGRFRATLSGTAAFNWSSPGTVINYPIFETAWLTNSPGVTSQTNTITTVGTTTSTYQVVGRNFFCLHDITITTVGTAGGSVIVQLPFTTAGLSIGPGRERGIAGKMLQVILNGADARYLNYDNSTPFGAGNGMIVSGGGVAVRLV